MLQPHKVPHEQLDDLLARWRAVDDPDSELAEAILLEFAEGDLAVIELAFNRLASWPST